MDYRNHRYQQIDRCVFTLSSDTQTDTTTTTITVSDLKSIVVVYKARLAETSNPDNGGMDCQGELSIDQEAMKKGVSFFPITMVQGAYYKGGPTQGDFKIDLKHCIIKSLIRSCQVKFLSCLSI